MKYLFILFLALPRLCFAELQLEKLLKDDWLEVRSENFIIVTDTKEKTAKQLAKDLEVFRFFITDTLGKNIVESKPLNIIAISSKKNFKRLDLPDNLAGVFKSGLEGDIAIANISNYSHSASNKSWGNQVLMHEYVHFVARSMSDSTFYPLWYNEGVAEYLASFRMEKGGKYITIGDMDVIGNRLYDLVNKLGSRYEEVDVEDLFKTTDIHKYWRRDDSGSQKRKDQRRVGKFYARAMITYHYLKSSAELSQSLSNYLTLLNNGHTVDYAFSNSFDMSYTELDEAIYKYMTGRYVKKLMIDVKVAGVKLPETNAKLRTLNSGEVYSSLIRTILRFNSYSIAERDYALTLADNYVKNSTSVDIARINYLSKSFPDADSIDEEVIKALKKQGIKLESSANRILKPLTLEQSLAELDKLIAADPENADLLATKAYHKLDNTIRKMKVGHPEAKKDFINLRKLARQAIRIDGKNALAYFVLGRATSQSDESRPKFVQEGATALDSARFLLGVKTTQNYLWNEIEMAMLLGNSVDVLKLARHYRTLNDSRWLHEGYGRFVVELFESWATPYGSIEKVEGNKISYRDGSTFVGEIKDKLPHGKGTLTTHFGSVAEGQWQEGSLQNKGTLKTSNGFEYKGDFDKGLATGHGSMTWPEGEHIVSSVGGFLMGMEHGAHKYVHDDGRIFEGNNRLGSFHGDVTVSKEGEILYEYHAFNGTGRHHVNDTLIFAGAMSPSFKATGRGTCYDKAENKIWRCRFEKGHMIENNAQTGNASKGSASALFN